MAPPATKRRKIQHRNASSGNDDGLASASNGGSLQENGVANSDTSMVDLEVGTHPSDVEYSSGEERPRPTVDRKKEEKHTNLDRQKKTRLQPGLAERPQDGVYNAEVYKSNMFKLQMDDLLQQVRVKYGKKEAPAEDAMRVLKDIIEQLPNREPQTISDAEKSLETEGIAIPFPQPRPPKDAKYKLQYLRPTSINATGSYPLKVASRNEEDLSIDLVVTMSEALFQEKDYLNHRYFYKRSYYLACLAAGIHNSEQHKFEVSFDCLGGNDLHPVILVGPSRDGGTYDFSISRSVIRIMLAIPESTFSKAKLHPHRNCIRNKVGDEVEGNIGPPTPFYNASVQADASVTAYLKSLHAASVKSEAFKDACILGRVWLRQRGLGTRIQKGGFGNFEWAAVVALLLQPNPKTGGSVLSAGYSSYQLFKGTLQFLARHDLCKNPYILDTQDAEPPKGDTTPMLFDGARNLNLLYKMAPWSYAHLQQEAKLSVEMLRDTVTDNFESTFIAKTHLLTHRYDATLEIPLSVFGPDTIYEDSHRAMFDRCRKLYTNLTRALTNRIVGMNILLPDEGACPVSSQKPFEIRRKSIVVTFAIDAANASRTVDHGPSAENKKEAASFRKFWGERAELRRFKDGSILETVVWSLKESSTPILEQIVRYTLKQHFGSDLADGARFASDTFAHLISPSRNGEQSGISGFSARMNGFAALEKDIRGLESLPLQIRHISAADPLLRYTAVHADSTQEVASIIVQFEGSARWPDDLCAIQRTKIAFLLKLADLLTSEKPGHTTRLGLENSSEPSQNQAYLDIHQPSGFTFRLRIHHDREATLLDRQLKDKTLDGPSRESAASALALYKRTYIQAPAHSQAIQTLCTRYPALSPSIRLTKRWFAAHLLSPHFSSELIELLVARTFLQPDPWSTPACATTGFLRTLLWISRWDWRHVPLIVDFSANKPSSDKGVHGAPLSSSLNAEAVEVIQTRFEAWRRIDPAMNRVVLFAATNLDNDGTTWTDSSTPERVVAARMTALAKAATVALRAQDETFIARALTPAKAPDEDGTDTGIIVPQTLFVSQLHEYDVVISIASKMLKSKKEAKYKNLEMQQGSSKSSHMQNVDYAPVVLFAEDLKNIYGDAVLWFWDPEALDTIAGLWNPISTTQRPWKVKAGWNSVPVIGKKSKDDDQSDAAVDIRINKAGISNEIARLGGSLISKVEVRR
ncbi:Nrap protein [Lophiostoma macrostomum CBS 122681]|uniref:U3 small nucleolar RNA-associated protein 22 n=1 Tax=Lophiostoma macrostomum CBS 122681 TaxID=1314788 RepID=A0A6A6TP23_9PLEO|nr:Nrap protein [Lophiostoma macrostomum CBS 122681]